MPTTTESGHGRTIIVLAIAVVGFAILCPTLLFPTASVSKSTRDDAVSSAKSPAKKSYTRAGAGGSSVCCDVISEKDTNAYVVMNEICKSIMSKHEQMLKEQRAQEQPKKKQQFVKPPSMVTLCRNEVLQMCGVDITGLLKEDHSITQEYKKSLGQLRTFNTSLCMKMNYGVDFREIGLPRKIKGPEAIPSKDPHLNAKE